MVVPVVSNLRPVQLPASPVGQSTMPLCVSAQQASTDLANKHWQGGTTRLSAPLARSYASCCV
eukprot:2051427-Rhodomonas_salina.2